MRGGGGSKRRKGGSGGGGGSGVRRRGYHHLTQPLMRIFEPVCKDVKAQLLSGK
jgi:hypothetical protein